MPTNTQIRDILDQAADLPFDRRPAFLDSACGSDVSLRAEVESLLSQLDTAEDFTVTSREPADAPTAARPEAATRRKTDSADVIGPYTLEDRIGEGGMGTVYRARQEKPIRRTVALKLIRGEFGSAQVIARFEAERQALARMDHPNIAKILDAGTHAGMPYFVMELVDGSPITKFCDQHRLSIPDRLELFAQVCDAIAHAHTKAILHRDIKAGNVLAFMADGKPRVKVIDFGIAKALTDDRLSDDLARTQEGRPIGTYESMSPEQAAGSADVDTRTDVYALGVLLYEMLCGFKPFAGQMIIGIDVLEVQRLIRDVDPPRPSTRVSPSADDSRTPDIADVRRTNPAELTKRLRSELEWIPLKAVRKERDRRYESAAQLASDVRNYLAGMPLIAGPDTRRYRAGKIVRRYKGVIAALASVLAVLVLGIAGTTVGLVREAKARRVAENQTTEADRQRKEAESQRDNAAAVVKFLTDDMLQEASPARTSDKAARDVLVKALLMPAGEKVGKRFAGKPLIEASVRDMLGIALNDVGRPDFALPHAKAAYELRLAGMGPDRLETIESENIYAMVLGASGRPGEAEPLFVDALGRSRSRLGPDHPATLRLLVDYGIDLQSLRRLSEAATLFQEAAERSRRTLGDGDVVTIIATGDYANSLFLQRRFDRAEPIYRELCQVSRKSLGPNSTDTLTDLDNYGVTLGELNRLPEAEAFCREAMEGRQKVLGDDHPDTIQSFNNYAEVLEKLGRSAQAEPLSLRAWKWRQTALGDDSPDTMISMDNYAAVLMSENRPAEAAPLCEKFWRFEEQAEGSTSPDTIAAQNRFRTAVKAIETQAAALRTEGDGKAALPLYESLLAEKTKLLGESDVSTIRTRFDLLDLRRSVLGNDDFETIQSMIDCAESAAKAGRPDLAPPLAKDALDRLERLLGKTNVRTIAARDVYGRALFTAGRFQSAGDALKTALGAAIVNPHLGMSNPLTKSIAGDHAKCLDAMGAHTAADDERLRFGLTARAPTTEPAQSPGQ